MTTTPIEHRDFYVYALFRQDGQTPFYIGKGRGNRMNIHEREAPRRTSHKDRIIQAMLADGCRDIPKLKLVEGLADREAKQIEIDLIHLLGRWPAGPLANLTSGGDGVANLAAESRARKSAANINSWSDPTVRAKRSNGMKAVWTEEKRAFHAEAARDRMTPEQRMRISVARKAAAQRDDVKEAVRAAQDRSSASKSKTMKLVWQDPQIRARRCAASKENQSRPEYRQKRSEAAKARWQDPAFRAKMKAARQKRQ